MIFKNADLYTVLADVVAIVPLVVILILAYIHRRKHGRRQHSRLFLTLLWILIFMAIVDGIVNLFGFRFGSEARFIEYVTMAVSLSLSTAFCLVWVGFINYKLYGRRDYLTRKIWLYVSPLIILMLTTLVAALFMRFHYSIAAVVIAVVSALGQGVLMIIYLAVSVMRIGLYRKQNGTLRFFKISYFFIPLIIIGGFSVFSKHTLGALGYAVGISMLYFFSIAKEHKYKDQETNFFNERYIEFVKRLIKKVKYPLGGVMKFELEDPAMAKDFSHILIREMPRNCEPVRYTPHEIMVLTKVADRSSLHLVTEDVEIAVEEWNKDASHRPISVKTGYDIIKKNETHEQFLNRIFSISEDQA